MESPLIIEVAINGLCDKSRNPHVPITADEIVKDAIDCLNAGASIIHCHGSSMNIDSDEAFRQYSAMFEPVLNLYPGAHLYPTAIRGDTLSERFAHFARLAENGLITMGYMDPGTANILGELDEQGRPFGGYAYTNSYDECNEQLEWFNANRVGPSLAIYEPGFLNLVLAYEKAGILPLGSFIKFYLAGNVNVATGGPTIPHGLPPTKLSLDAFLAMLGSSEIPWAVSILGGDIGRSDVLGYALAKGGHVRLGLEDFGGDRTPRNVELVEEVVQQAARLGRRPATPSEVARILRMPQAQDQHAPA